jgi:enediyne biosynthesis protein E4
MRDQLFARVVGCALAISVAVFGVAGQTPTAKTSSIPSSPVPGHFVDATSKLGIDFVDHASPTAKKYLLEAMGSGVALFDYDNDGRLDIFVANGASIQDPTAAGTIPQKTSPKFSNCLYHQKPDGTFEEVTEKAGLAGIGYSTGVAVGDYDNDGYEDLFVAGYGHSMLYHNNGDGTFSDVTAAAGVAGSGWATSAAWVDIDNDGRLDLIVTRYMEWDFKDIYCGHREEGYRAYCHPDLFKPATTLVYHNDGNGKFTEVSKKVGLDKPSKGLGIAIADYDHDGWMDIFIANDSIPEFLFHNKGNGTFEEVGLASGAGLDGGGATFAGMGVDFADYNNDGWADIVVTDLANQRYALYRNAKDGTFDYVSNPTGLAAITLLHSAWGVRFLDYDNDGWKDLFIAQSHVMDTIEVSEPHLHYAEPPLLLWNSKGEKFVDVSAQSGEVFTRKWVGRGLATGDINNDGRDDVVITSNNGPAWALMNETETHNHWINLKLVGVKSNRDAIGASIKISTDAGDQFATVTTSSSYQSSSDKRVHFGLGSAVSVNRIEISWPSGIHQMLTGAKADQFLTITESASPTN